MDVAVGEAQMRIRVPASSAAHVSFQNLGPGRSSLADICFEGAGGTLLDLFYVANTPGISFSAGAGPPQLPGENNLGSEFFAHSHTDSNGSAAANGINPPESLRIAFTLPDGFTFQDILDGLADAWLMIGLQARNILGAGNGESFVNWTIIVPIPGAFLLRAVGSVWLVGPAGKAREE